MSNGKTFSIGKNSVVACIWDFDKTLSPNYTQQALFEQYDLDLEKFWQEINALPEYYLRQGVKVSEDNIWQNHLLTYVGSGRLPGVSNAKLRETGKHVKFFPGLPSFFDKIKNFVSEEYKAYNITLEHYIVSSGIAEIIRGSDIAQYVDGIFACEFIETPAAPGFLENLDKVDKVTSAPARTGIISQVGMIVDNTHKTRCIFEINKGCNKDPNISINSSIDDHNRRIPIKRMIYIADGPSDIPAFTVVRHEGGLGYAVYNPASDAEFEQNDRLLSAGRIDAYGPADYTDNSSTVRWLKMHIKNICDELCQQQEAEKKAVIGRPPVHIHD